MEIPEDLRCCICSCATVDMIRSVCSHRFCLHCVECGALNACPVCRAPLSEDRVTDAEFAEYVQHKRILCECGIEVPVLNADAHDCEHTRSRACSTTTPSIVSAIGRTPPPPAPNRATFTCPLCTDGTNLSRQGLLDHCDKCHAGCVVAAVCPICLSMPWGDPNYKSSNFISHLRLRHKCDYDVLADYENDEESVLRSVLGASAREAGVDGQLEASLLARGDTAGGDALDSLGFHLEDTTLEDMLLEQVLAESAREAAAAVAATTAPGNALADAVQASQDPATSPEAEGSR